MSTKWELDIAEPLQGYFTKCDRKEGEEFSTKLTENVDDDAYREEEEVEHHLGSKVNKVIRAEMVVCADGARSRASSLFGFERKAPKRLQRLLGITCNFVNKKSLEERLLKVCKGNSWCGSLF